MSSRIELINATKRFGETPALQDVSMAIAPGERVALVGHNGAGKTTLIKLALGILKPDQGTIRLDGADPAGSDGPEVRSGVGFLPESVVFQGALSGRDTLRFLARLKRVRHADIDSLLASVGLQQAADKRVETYSKGMRQRLGLAQAFLGQPKILILDEPTSGLDPILRRSFYQRIDDLAKAGTTILLSSHALTELAFRTDRIAILDHGRLTAFGSIRQLAVDAALPVRIRVRVPCGRAEVMGEELRKTARLSHVNDRQVELSCPTDDKMAVLRHIAELGPDVLDIEVDPPSLEDVYASYQKE